MALKIVSGDEAASSELKASFAEIIGPPLLREGRAFCVSGPYDPEMPKPGRVLDWRRTSADPQHSRDDYWGTDPASPWSFARVYLSEAYPDPSVPWSWTVTGAMRQAANGQEASVEAAVDAAEAAYVRWRDSQSRKP